ncbi:fumarylacetoacetate hydrolase family protein [Sphingopyxis sp. JAI128]|uniref:fumarylacetoacetate hydrolase family protein n=1 Tax=Sphingopyxis sp. JAI128 TaxID=2723066 RepID=UPI00161079AC|nr:fumarylacetoacetate hydrolase family protein [Sphingopyxis sp. JAI128]MBB6427856.1 2-keto-4-pentenoate hydratase/2-oxohepta-3-ene-1,7-dioic acid hydratase in catechol pathway [Sphingopyxis sp. JAI128]
MRIASFIDGETVSYGLVKDGGIIDAGARFGGQPLEAILPDLTRLGELSALSPDVALSDVSLLPPVPNSGRIVCVGLNYKTHIEETGNATPPYPILFPRYPSSLVGHDAPLVKPRVSERFDFEGELAVIVGKGGRHIPAARALDHVAGYACFNDGSIRDFQRHTSQFMPGKNFDRSGSFGPWLVTPDEAGDVNALTLTTRLNGRIMQQSGIDDLLFGVEALIAYMSQIWEIRPGDVIATGTAGGVGAAREPQLWMRPGDRIEVEIDRLGILANTIIEEEKER